MNQSETTRTNDEIDIVDLFRKLVDLVKRRFKLFLLFILAGIIEGSVYYYIAVPQYKSTLIANSEMLRNEYVTMLFNNLNELIKEGNPEQLAKLLKIDLQTAKSLTKIQATKVELKELKVDGLNQQALTNTFQIDVMVTNTENLASIQNGIIYYIKNNDFVKKRVDLQRNLLESMIAELDKQIQKLDSTRYEINRSFKRAQDSRFLVLQPSEINTSLVTLNERKLNYENALELLNEVLVIQEFIKYNKPASPKIITSISITIGSMITFALILIGILELWRLIK